MLCNLLKKWFDLPRNYSILNNCVIDNGNSEDRVVSCRFGSIHTRAGLKCLLNG